MSDLRLDNIVKQYSNGYKAVHGISFDVNDGEFISLLGPSGCGKSTTLRMIAGLEDITSGSMYIGDKLVNHLPSKDRGIAMVFQSYALFPHMTVEANIGFGLKIKKIDKKTRYEKIDWALDLLDLQQFRHRRPAELSGGQRQRVALGRALVLEPDVLLLDEPLSNLDAKLRVKMRTEIKRIHKKLKATTIYVTHDQEEAMTLSDRIIIMNKGEIVQMGTPSGIYKNPSCRFVAGFMGSPPFNFIDGAITHNAGINTFAYEGGIVEIPAYLNDRIASEIDKDNASIAVRPEDFVIVDKPSKYTIEGITSVRETVGAEDFVTVEVGKTLVTVRVETDDPVEMDTPVYLEPKLNKLYIFNRE